MSTHANRSNKGEHSQHMGHISLRIDASRLLRCAVSCCASQFTSDLNGPACLRVGNRGIASVARSVGYIVIAHGSGNTSAGITSLTSLRGRSQRGMR